MTFNELKAFLLSQMKMSHIYQPVMVKTLLERNGTASDRDIAIEIAKYDQSQIEYYQNVTNKMVGRVLLNHKVVSKKKKDFFIEEFGTLSSAQIEELISICDYKLDDYVMKRGERIWQHRSTNREPISGSIRYQVLKRAEFRCELCGISAKEKALEVDHIVPRNLGGENSINNYQALCYSCNAMKRDKDSTDFRLNSVKYDQRDFDCPLCNKDKKKVISENNLAYLIYYDHPLTNLHSILIPKRHFSDFFNITQPELNAINALMSMAKEKILDCDKNISGFNIGINTGSIEGQKVCHCHTHLIPRRDGDKISTNTTLSIVPQSIQL